MKKIIVALVGAYLFFLFLSYCGIFRNDRNPGSVIRYYYDSIKNGEWFLTYQIASPSYFDVGRIFDNEYLERKFYLLEKISKMDVLTSKENHVSLGIELTYKNKEKLHSIVELEMIEGRWLIKDIKYL